MFRQAHRHNTSNFFKTGLNCFRISTLRVTDVQSNGIVSLGIVKMENTSIHAESTHFSICISNS